MADAWPLTLPQTPLSGTYSEQRQDNVKRGPAAPGAESQRRRRFSAAAKTVSFSMNLTKAQLATLETFYVTTLASGTYGFEFTDPTSDDTKEFSFLEPYRVDHISVDDYRVSMTLIRKAE